MQHAIEKRRAFEAKLIAGFSIAEACDRIGIPHNTGYRWRRAFDLELQAAGTTIVRETRRRRAAWDRVERAIRVVRFAIQTGEAADRARAAGATRSRPMSFDEQLARVRAGARLIRKPVMPARPIDMTLGGIGSALL